jgi:hypothetical protein
LFYLARLLGNRALHALLAGGGFSFQLAIDRLGGGRLGLGTPLQERKPKQEMCCHEQTNYSHEDLGVNS